MDLSEIRQCLDSEDSQDRMRAITALRSYDAETAVPLLCGKIRDPEFLIRSFIAMGLGRKRTAQAFEALLILLEDVDANVRAEASSALALYGDRAFPHLLAMFNQDQHWLVRRSILAALGEVEQPDILLRLCVAATQDGDLTVRETTALMLGQFAQTKFQTTALDQLLRLAQVDEAMVRAAAARSLRQYDLHQAREALCQLQRDPDHRVVAAVLEGLVEN
ncbi:MAG: HEAT repeat domain-containing protein [Synechococcales cyanobacterium RM1_1_8]|nr:HEAT repeat domain-containing protein [Synechococcales cyanobacterium RM1_1_8]